MKPEQTPRTYVQSRQNSAPLLFERDQYLRQLDHQGTNAKHIRVIGARLVQINRLLEMSVLRRVDSAELERAVEKGMDELRTHPARSVTTSSAYTLRNTARNWLRFNGCLIVLDKPKPPFDGILLDFIDFIKVTRGTQSASIKNLQSKLCLFMDWAARRRSRISDVTLTDIDEYIQMKRQAGLKPRSLAMHCYCLRTFYRWANIEGWTEQKISYGLRSPRVPQIERTPKGPSWSDVRRLVDSITGVTPAALRFKAIVLLCSIYGLRNIEVRRLVIDDFDWESAVITVRRAKGGKLQQFPLQYEVGDAILAYLRYGRPKCRLRTLFVSHKGPIREMNGSVLPQMIRKRLRLLKISSEYKGAHGLRHSCATELLHQGSCLSDIASFLGHRTLSSVGIYAKLDEASLRLVADFDLKAIL